MVSIRQLAQCIGISGDFSIIRDFYGYCRVPNYQTLSLASRSKSLQNQHIHLNLIRVGTNENGSLTAREEERIDLALYCIRKIYGAVHISIGRVERYHITESQANGKKDITDDNSEAEALTNEWTVNNDAIDVFLVQTYQVKSSSADSSEEYVCGWSTISGPCDKNDTSTMNGCVLGIKGFSAASLGLVLAHEVGHYLGLDHDEDPYNVMFYKLPSSFLSKPSPYDQLRENQAEIMRAHCFMKIGCQV